MFTGIVEELGCIKNISRSNLASKLTIGAKQVLEDTRLGDSICTNGVCLTVTKLMEDGFVVDVMPETMRKSNLGELRIGDKVHLERAATLSSRLGGHLVSGHIDGVGMIHKIKQEENAVWLSIAADETILKFVIHKGSIAIDGVSLTVAAVSRNDFAVSLIPHTQEKTHLLQKGIGESVNLECDMIGKYVAKFMMNQNEGSKMSREEKISKDFLAAHSFL